MLFLQGTRDALANAQLLKRLIKKWARVRP